MNWNDREIPVNVGHFQPLCKKELKKGKIRKRKKLRHWLYCQTNQLETMRKLSKLLMHEAPERKDERTRTIYASWKPTAVVRMYYQGLDTQELCAFNFFFSFFFWEGKGFFLSPPTKPNSLNPWKLSKSTIIPSRSWLIRGNRYGW